MPRFDPEAILRTLIEHEVDFVLIGGVAATLHGSNLRTGDVDVCPRRGRDNLVRLASALNDLEARFEPKAWPKAWPSTAMPPSLRESICSTSARALVTSIFRSNRAVPLASRTSGRVALPTISAVCLCPQPHSPTSSGQRKQPAGEKTRKLYLLFERCWLPRMVGPPEKGSGHKKRRAQRHGTPAVGQVVGAPGQRTV